MVYIAGMKLTGDVSKELNITKVTLFGWIRNGIIKADKVAAGSRSVYVFEDEEIERVRKLLPKLRRPGLQIITPKILSSIKKDREGK